MAPNLIKRFYLLRPTALFSAEPMCTLTQLRTSLTLDDLADMHEALDLREHLAAKVAASLPKGPKHGRR